MGSVTGLIVVLLTALVAQFTAKEFADWVPKNVEIRVHDRSIQFENPSFKVEIDGLTVCEVDSISHLEFRDIRVKLDNGKHRIEISTIDDKLKVTDSIQVANYPEAYSLDIKYHYNPPIDEYKKIHIERNYKLYIEGYNFSEVQKSDILYWVKREINNDPHFRTWYKPGSRHFTVEFGVKKDNYFIID